MSYLDQLIAGKFKNVSFGTRNERLNNVGQSRVEHRYPKTKVQYLEPMGEEPFDCTVEVFFTGETYRDDFEKFRKAAQDPAPGRLFLPTFGVFNSVIVFPFSADANQKTVGEITASVRFAQTTDRPAPTEGQTSQQDVSEQAAIARENLQESFKSDYIEPKTVSNIETGSYDAKSLASDLEKVTGKARDVRNFVRKVDRKLQNADQYASLLLNPGQPLGFLQSTALSFTGNSGFVVFKKLATLGTNQTNSMNDIKSGIVPSPSGFLPQDPGDGSVDVNVNLWTEDTLERIQRNISRLSVINTFRVTGLIGMFESAASSTYTTTEDVDNVVKTLEDYYEAIIENDSTGVVIPGVKFFLEQLRNLTDRVLAQKRQQAYTVIEIDIERPVSAFLLAYELYGEYLQTEAAHEFMTELLVGLNRSQVAYRLEGAVKVVEVGS